MYASRSAKLDKMQVLIFPPALIISAVLIYKAYRWVAPPALTIDSIEVVDVVQAYRGLTPLRKNGIMFHQSEPLTDGGSSRLLVTRPADEGTHVLVQGRIAHGFLGSKIELGKMINLKINTRKFEVEADREPVPFILLTPRTTPVQVELGSMLEGVSQEQIAPTQLTGLVLAEDPNQHVNNSEIEVEFQPSDQGGSAMPGLMSLRMDVKFNEDGTAWIELPRSFHLPSPAIGGEDLEVGFLIPLDSAAEGRYAIRLFGDRVARLPRDLFSNRGGVAEP